MIRLVLDTVLFGVTVLALHGHGLPLLAGALVMAVLYFLSSWVFLLAGISGVVALFFVP